MDETPAPPRWRAVVGLLLGLALVALLVGRATGVVGSGQILSQDDAPDASETPAVTSPSVTTGATEPTGTSTRTTGDPVAKKSREGRDRPEAVATDMPGGAELASRVQDLLGEEPEPEPAEFRMGSFNVLGASHTTSRGNKPQYASGVSRMQGAVRLLADTGVDVVGFQEFEMVQYHALKRMTGDRYAVYPGPALGRGPIRNSVAWRQDTWDLVDARTIPIPYFRGKRVPMPYVLLKHQASGQPVYFINIHNPTSNKKRGNNERWRDLATRLETTLARRLNRADVPVILMGDFNERSEAFCRVTGAGLVAANGGRPGPPCVPPASAGIDWIFGTRDISFSDYARYDSGLVNRVTDHPMLVVTARVGG